MSPAGRHQLDGFSDEAAVDGSWSPGRSSPTREVNVRIEEHSVWDSYGVATLVALPPAPRSFRQRRSALLDHARQWRATLSVQMKPVAARYAGVPGV